MSETTRTRTIATAIATLVALIRPDWRQAGMATLIEREAAGADIATITLALLLAAQDGQSKTPARAFVRTGPIWQQATRRLSTTQAQPERPPKTSEECRTHPGQWARRCPACATDLAITAAHAAHQAACPHEHATTITYDLRGPNTAHITAWHCPDCDLTTRQEQP